MQTKADTSRLLGTGEVAKRLGVSVWTVRSLAKVGALAPCVRVGKLFRFPPSAVENYVTRQTLKPAA